MIEDPIEEFTSAGIKTKSGKVHESDIIVLATGFDIYEATRRYECFGKGGRSREKQWGDAPNAYLGVCTPSEFRLSSFILLALSHHLQPTVKERMQS